MAFPDHQKDIGLPFDDAYALAVQMRGMTWPKTQVKGANNFRLNFACENHKCGST